VDFKLLCQTENLYYNSGTMEVLIIEDEIKVVDFISKGLEEEGYSVSSALDGRQGLDLIKARKFDIVLLDLMIPEIDGLKVLKSIRSWGINTPVLIITAKNTKEDVVLGLDMGSDDYLTKPFSFDELLARIRALLRRSAARDGGVIKYGDMLLNPYSRVLSVESKEVELTEKEFLIIELLLRNNERPLTRKEIAEYVWQNGTESTNIVDVYINFLRKKIESISSHKYIHTVRGIGYVLKEEDEKIL
jgi:two-component system, OmpR family, copper resistance phosphate regulon response regulator CusR